MIINNIYFSNNSKNYNQRDIYLSLKNNINLSAINLPIKKKVIKLLQKEFEVMIFLFFPLTL